MALDRWIRLRADADRDAAANDRTVALPVEQRGPGLTAHLRAGRDVCEVSFIANYREIREVAQGFRQRGLLAVAIDEAGVAATLCMGSSPDRINAGIVGRHGACDLWLPGDPAVSLRHLAVIVHAAPSAGRVRYRLLDLRTGSAFTDERGARVESIESDGPVFVHVGRYALLLFPLDGALEWPPDALAAWRALPARQYEVHDAPARHWHDRPIKRPRRRAGEVGRVDGDPEVTLVRVVPGPTYAQRRALAGPDEARLGEMRVKSGAHVASFLVGDRSAQAGLLLGRYDRCDNRGLDTLNERSISRVHLLLLGVGGALWAIDTASTNGIWAGGCEIDSHRLEFGDRLVLAGTNTELEWRPVH